MNVQTAYEEAGHALIARAFGIPVELVAVSPDGGMTKASEPLGGDGSLEALERSLVLTLAGTVARTYAPTPRVDTALGRERADGNGSAVVSGLLAMAEGSQAAETGPRGYSGLHFFGSGIWVFGSYASVAPCPVPAVATSRYVPRNVPRKELDASRVWPDACLDAAT